MSTGRRKSPCTRECPERSPTCHAECERYLAFFAENRKAQEDRVDRIHGIDAANEIRKHHNDLVQRKKNRRR